PSRAKMLALLRPGSFRRYIIGSAISDTGTWMQVMAQGWVMSTLTNKTILLGMVNFAAGIPTLALTMLGGSVADKYDKRKILIWTQFAQTALALIVGILVYTGRIHVWHVVVIAAFLGICIAFEMPAINALVPELVKRDEIATAIALDRSVFHCRVDRTNDYFRFPISIGDAPALRPQHSQARTRATGIVNGSLWHRFALRRIGIAQRCP